MSQEYTPVDWVDETPNTPGTLINKARLDQMQTAHHYADGFEEVDAVPTADPGVDYHKVVFCTADTTFYRWDGSAWVKDVDDTTKALLEAHEADHANPHVVTKAQVGLGNCDNTSDLDKPVSTAMQTALDAKLDDSQLKTSWSSPVSDANIPSEKLTKDTLDAKLDDSQLKTAWSSPVKDTNIPSEKLTKDSLDLKANKTQLSDGSVTKIGTEIVGSIQQPIFLLNGVPTACNTMVDTISNQTVMGKKISTFSASTSAADNAPDGFMEKVNNVTVNSTTSNRYFFLKGAVDYADKLLAGISVRYNSNGDVHYSLGTTDSNGSATGYEIAKFVRSTNTWTSEMVSDLLDAYTTMVRTVNNQTIAGVKTFTSAPYTRIDSADGVNIHLRNNNLTLADQTGGHNTSIAIRGANDALLARLRYRNGVVDSLPTRNFQVDLYDSSGTAHVFELCRLQNGVEYAPVLTGGAQTIAGVKTFTNIPVMKISGADTNYLVFQSDTLDQSVTGTQGRVRFPWYDKNGIGANNRIAEFSSYRRTNGDNSLYLSIFDTVGGSLTSAGLEITLETNGTAHVECPNRTYNASNTSDVVNIALLDAYTPMVRTTGNQTIAGAKSFTAEMTNERTANFVRCYTVKASGIFTENANPTEDKTIWPLIIGNGNLSKFPFRIATIQRPNGDFVTEFSLRDPQTNVERANLRLTSPTSGTGKLEFYNGSQWTTIAS